MFILKKGHQPGVYVPLRALFLVFIVFLIFLFVPGVFCCQHFSGPSRVSDYFGSTT